MFNLIKMDIYRLIKTKSYKFGLLVSLIISFTAIAAIAGLGKLIPLFSEGEDMSGFLFIMPYSDWFSGVSIFTVIITATTFLSLMVSCMISSDFINNEQVGGYIKNIAGQVKSKSMLIISKFVTITVIALTVFLAYVIGASVSSFLFLGHVINFNGISDFLTVLIVRFVLYLAVNTIVLFLCTLTKSKSLAIAFGIVFGTGITRIAYTILETFIEIIVKVNIPIGKFTPDGLVFNIKADSPAGDLTQAFAVGVIYIVVFLILSSLILKKRDTK